MFTGGNPMFTELRDLADDVRRLFAEIDRDPAAPACVAATECLPPLDVLDTAAGVEIVVDLPGVAADSIRVVAKGATILILGEKPAACSNRDARFHLAERAFGRFARAVRLSGAFDLARAEATLRAGELRLRLPRIDDRRGREIVVPVRRHREAS
jgi:HSP20 family protein